MKAHILSNKSGNVLILSMVALFMVASATTGVLLITANALHMSDRQQASTSAFNAAESGAEEAALWLKNQSMPPTGTSAIAIPVGVVGGVTPVVAIYPDQRNPSSFLKTYRIESTAVVRGVSKTVEVVVKQASFGRYAYFTDKETSSVSGGAIWWKAGEKVDGPVHSNNTSGSNFNINYNGSSAPIFLDMVTASGSSISYTPSRPRDETTFKRIFRDGSMGFKLKVPPIALPSSSDVQRNAAWGSAAGFPTTNGVYLRAGSNGGVYIQGDAAMQLSTDASGNQLLTITQGSNVTTIKLDKFAQTASATGPVGVGSETNSASMGTGVIYCSGNIVSLGGEVADNRVVGSDITVRSAFTIATDVNASKYIRVSNNLVYHTRPDKTLDSDDPVNLAAGTLGLVAKDIRIWSSAPKDLEIDAVCLAGGQNTTDGSFYVENYDHKTPTGTLKVLGGIIQKARGPVGTFDPSTGKTSTGYAKNYTYDPRLAATPPPFYPTTGQYERVSWQVLAK